MLALLTLLWFMVLPAPAQGLAECRPIRAWATPHATCLAHHGNPVRCTSAGGDLLEAECFALARGSTAPCRDLDRAGRKLCEAFAYRKVTGCSSSGGEAEQIAWCRAVVDVDDRWCSRSGPLKAHCTRLVEVLAAPPSPGPLPEEPETVDLADVVLELDDDESPFPDLRIDDIELSFQAAPTAFLGDVSPLPRAVGAPPRQVRIAIRGADLHRTAEFYAAFERLMARAIPEEWARPRVAVSVAADSMLRHQSFDFLIQLPELDDPSPPRGVTAGQLLAMVLEHSGSKDDPRDVVRRLGRDAIQPFGATISAGWEGGKAPVWESEDREIATRIVGGVGPLAGAGFFQELARAQRERGIDGRVGVGLLSNPVAHRPAYDRVKKLFGSTGRGALDYKRGLDAFLHDGVSVEARFAVSSNTAHKYLPSYGLKRGAAFTSMIEAVAATVDQGAVFGDTAGVALFATSKVARSGLYDEAFAAHPSLAGRLVKPDAATQALVQRGIDEAKRGDLEAARVTFVEALAAMDTSSINALIMGCTEIPLALHDSDTAGLLLIDSSRALAEQMATDDVERLRP